jgi:hypothetical protein
VPTKTVLKVGFLERDFERDHLAEKSNQTKMGQKIHWSVRFSPERSTLPVTNTGNKSIMRYISRVVMITDLDPVQWYSRNCQWPLHYIIEYN